MRLPDCEEGANTHDLDGMTLVSESPVSDPLAASQAGLNISDLLVMLSGAVDSPAGLASTLHSGSWPLRRGSPANRRPRQSTLPLPYPIRSSLMRPR